MEWIQVFIILIPIFALLFWMRSEQTADRRDDRKASEEFREELRKMSKNREKDK